MEEKKTSSLKVEKICRLIFRILFVIFSVIIPIIIVASKYHLIREFSGYKLSVVGLVLCITILWWFKGRLLEWITSWEYSILKYILLGFSKVYIFIIVLVILLMARHGIERLIFCIEWISLCECVSYLIIYPLEEKHDYNVKRLIRGQERKEDYKEAIKDLQRGND